MRDGFVLHGLWVFKSLTLDCRILIYSSFSLPLLFINGLIYLFIYFYSNLLLVSMK